MNLSQIGENDAHTRGEPQACLLSNQTHLESKEVACIFNFGDVNFIFMDLSNGPNKGRPKLTCFEPVLRRNLRSRKMEAERWHCDAGFLAPRRQHTNFLFHFFLKCQFEPVIVSRLFFLRLLSCYFFLIAFFSVLTHILPLYPFI